MDPLTNPTFPQDLSSFHRTVGQATVACTGCYNGFRIFHTSGGYYGF